MSSKQPAAKSAPQPAAKSAAPVPKKERKPRQPSLSLSQKFDLLNAIKAADPTTPDATLAESLSVTFGRKVLPLSVAGYRKEFGLASVKRPKASELQAALAAANARIAQLEMELSSAAQAA